MLWDANKMPALTDKYLYTYNENNISKLPMPSKPKIAKFRPIFGVQVLSWNVHCDKLLKNKILLCSVSYSLQT